MKLSSFLAGHLARFTVGVLLLLLVGCESQSAALLHKAKEKQYFTPTNFNGDTRLPVNLRRVVMLPVFGGTVIPSETSSSIEDAFVEELQKTQRFELVRLSRSECMRHFGVPEFSSVGVLPHDFLVILGKEFAADAVLFVDITSYRGYRPLVLGVRAKLATVDQTRLIWNFDEVFSADDPLVANSVRHFYGSADTSGVPIKAGQGALQSPGKFAAYVGAATFDTLPPR